MASVSRIEGGTSLATHEINTGLGGFDGSFARFVGQKDGRDDRPNEEGGSDRSVEEGAIGLFFGSVEEGVISLFFGFGVDHLGGGFGVDHLDE